MTDPIAFNDPQTAIEWGAALRNRRLVVDYSQGKLAELLSVERWTLSNWEDGRGLVKILKFIGAFEACGCDLIIKPSATLIAQLRAKSSRVD